jgi:hypothetical protein
MEACENYNHNIMEACENYEHYTMEAAWRAKNNQYTMESC